MDMNNTKKITNLSAIVLVVASTIGAGIFFKNGELTKLAQGDLAFVLASWGVAIFGIMALAFALIELSSAQKTNKGTQEWTKLFTPAWFHHTISKYNRLIVVPITSFALAIYIVSTFVDAGWNLTNGYLVLLLGLGITTFFIGLNMISLRAAEISQWISKGVQAVPLIILPILAMISPLNDADKIIKENIVGTFDGLQGVSKWMILIGGVPAITFAFDGFYTVASLRQDLEKPSDVGKVSFLGVLAISIIYLFVTLGFSLGSRDGTLNGIKWFDNDIKSKFLNAANVFIAVGMMGIVNGYAMSGIRQFKSQMDSNEVPEISLLHKTIFKGKFGSKWTQLQREYFTTGIYVFLTNLFYFLVVGPIGVSVYKSGWDDSYGTGAIGADSLYGFTDVVTNFTSMIMFSMIATTILGGLINRKTKKVEVHRSKIFVPSAIIGIVAMYSSLIYMVLVTIVDMTGFNGADKMDALIKFMFFISLLGACALWTLIEIKTKRIVNGEYTKVHYKSSEFQVIENKAESNKVISQETVNANVISENDIVTKIGIIFGIICAIITSFSVILLPFTIWTINSLLKLNKGDQSKKTLCIVLSIIFGGFWPGILILIGDLIKPQQQNQTK